MSSSNNNNKKKKRNRNRNRTQWGQDQNLFQAPRSIAGDAKLNKEMLRSTYHPTTESSTVY